MFIKKRILCFGDSNTWGYIPGSDHERFSEDIRFSKVLQSLLGENFEIIEEGLNSRTLTSKDLRPGKEGIIGSKYLIPCLDSHDPLDLVIIMLGTNEIKNKFGNNPEKIGNIFNEYFVNIILNRKSQFQEKYPKLLIISLPVINEKAKLISDEYIGGGKISDKLKDIYKKIAYNNNCYFLDSSGLSVGIDGVHLTKESHILLANELLKKLKTIPDFEKVLK